jgi:hypothetical protein
VRPWFSQTRYLLALPELDTRPAASSARHADALAGHRVPLPELHQAGLPQLVYAQPPPPSGPIKGRAPPLARAQQGRRPSPPLPDAAGSPWSHHPGSFLPKSNPPRAWPLPTEAPRSDFTLPASPEKRSHHPVPPSSAPRRGEPRSDHLRSSHDHPRVALEPLSIFPHFPLAAGQPHRREPPRQTLLCS